MTTSSEGGTGTVSHGRHWTAFVKKGGLVIAVVVPVMAAGGLNAGRQSQSEIGAIESTRVALDSAIAAHGGRARFAAIRSIRAELRGDLSMLGQSPAPDGPLDVEPAEMVTVFDRDNDRWLQETENSYPTGFTFRFRQVVRPDAAFRFELTQALQGRRWDRLAQDQARILRALMSRSVGPFYLPYALELATGGHVRLVDSRKNSRVVEVTDAAGSMVVKFDERSGLLTEFETRSQHPIVGPIVQRTVFDEFHKREGLTLPSIVRDFRNGQLAQSGRIHWSLNKSPVGTSFAEPAGMPKRASKRKPLTC